MLEQILAKAEKSRLHRALLSKVLYRVIPFNHPHKFSIKAISSELCEVRVPYRKSNLNHIKGIHACALATACEFSSGLLLLRLVGQSKYRLIMKELHMVYHYQGKMDSVASCYLSSLESEDQIITPLTGSGVVEPQLSTQVSDKAGNALCTGTILWQIKSWEKVKTKT